MGDVGVVAGDDDEKSRCKPGMLRDVAMSAEHSRNEGHGGLPDSVLDDDVGQGLVAGVGEREGDIFRA
jgi:hypothetical protein